MAAKQFQVPVGASNLYLYRNEDIVFNNEIPVDIDGKHAGNTIQVTIQFLEQITRSCSDCL